MFNLIKFETWLSTFVFFIIFIKLAFMVTIIGNAYNNKVLHNDTLSSSFTYWKERTEFIFTFCMAILLILIFHPRYKNQIYVNKEISLLFFIFGFVILFTSNWSLFISNAGWYNTIIKLWK
jgi:hypothetical protein